MTHNDEFKTLIDKLEEVCNQLKQINEKMTSQKKIVRRKKKI